MLCWTRRTAFVVGAAACATGALAASSSTQISSDPYSDPTTIHATVVNPSVAVAGTTIVSAFEAGRGSSGGSNNIGWAASTDSGSTWKQGFLPSLTATSSPPGSYQRASNPSVAFDAVHRVWLIATIDLVSTRTRFTNVALTVSRSSDGVTWNAPTIVTTANGPDLSSITCDNYSSSRKRGTCYVTWAASQNGDRLLASASADGGRTWGAPVATVDSATGSEAQAVVTPNGTIIAVARKSNTLISYGSSNGGGSWSSPVALSRITHHKVGGGLREAPKASLGVDARGTVFAVWSDCRYRTKCASNDIVMAASSDGVHWPATTRVGIDSVSSSLDHFLPGLAVDSTTAGGRARLAVVYYFYPVADCGVLGRPDCRLSVGLTTSRDGGATWSAPATISSAPFPTLWLPLVSTGRMVGDQSAAAIDRGRAAAVFASAAAPEGASLRLAMHSQVTSLQPSRSLMRSAIVRQSGAVSFPSSTLRSDIYTLVVLDRSGRDNFHIAGPGVNKRTGLSFIGRAHWRLKLLPGTYEIGNDRTKKTTTLQVF